MNISFQLLLYTMKEKSQEDQQLCSLNFSDAMWKPSIVHVFTHTFHVHCRQDISKYAGVQTELLL